MEYSNKSISVCRQCELLGISRSGKYYQPHRAEKGDCILRGLIDEIYTGAPFYGQRRIKYALKDSGYKVGRVRIRRLMRELGLSAIYPKRNLSRPGKKGQKYPYLLSGYEITKPLQVWSTDITYIRLAGGYVYLTAVIDWNSRYVLAWELSNTLDNGFCIAVVKRALGQGTPDIFNTDQGSQYTSEEFLKTFDGTGVQISMDGRGRALDNIFIERLWRTVKYEEVYLKQYKSMQDARENLSRYFKFYNTKRRHQALGYKTPEAVHFGTERSRITEGQGKMTQHYLNTVL